MPITLDQAKALRPGQTVYHAMHRNRDGSAQRWKVNGQPKTWKTQPERVRVPLKYGLYAYDALSENDLHLVSLSDPTTN